MNSQKKIHEVYTDKRILPVDLHCLYYAIPWKKRR